MLWKIVLVLGILGVLLGILVTGGSALLPVFTDGRVKIEGEAIFGIIAGVLVLVVSFLMFLIGLIFVLKNRKKSA